MLSAPLRFGILGKAVPIRFLRAAEGIEKRRGESGFSLDKVLVMAASVGSGIILYFLLARLVGIYKEEEMFSFLKRG